VLCGIRRDGYAAEAAIRLVRRFSDHIREQFDLERSVERVVSDLLVMDENADDTPLMECNPSEGE
jgi:hypothetical protein